ncbi:MAG: inositol monophosphatase family protein [Candidatus Neomarinimicrobiota bacterium]
MFNEELIAAKVAARNTGKILIKHLNVDDKNIEYKSKDSPVTIADHEADQYLSDFIGGEFPHDGWLSEETVDTEERLEKKRTWIVDPLDGTKTKNILKNFLNFLLVLLWFRTIYQL